MAADAQQDKLGKKTLIDNDVLEDECVAVEADLVKLKVTYEQYFLGLERRPPTQQYEDFKKRVTRLKSQFTRATGLKFKINSLYQKFVSYDRLWQRTLQEMEAGTYRRDLFKAKLHNKKVSGEAKAGAGKKDDFDIEEDLGDMGLDDALAEAEAAVSKPPPPKTVPPVAAVVPGVAPVGGAKPAGATPAAASAVARPGAPGSAGAPPARPAGATPAAPVAAAAKAPAPAMTASGGRPAVTAPAPARASSAEAVSDAKVKAIYDAYVTAKRRCGEDTSKLTLDSVAQTVRKQVPEIMEKHKAKGVDFKVVIKDGKALLRAVPKE